MHLTGSYFLTLLYFSPEVYEMCNNIRSSLLLKYAEFPLRSNGISSFLSFSRDLPVGNLIFFLLIICCDFFSFDFFEIFLCCLIGKGNEDSEV